MSKPVLIDFYAEWCGPCKMQTPIIEKVKEALGDQIEVRTLDVDQHMKEAQDYRIAVVPTLVIEKDGKVIRRLEGVTGAAELQQILAPLVAE
ncbi:MAG: thioredoxin fold domain-containing protein [Methanospirillum sp.]|nr:thioredoxin fold domain-containing protein [Methanospirillum sp.]